MKSFSMAIWRDCWTLADTVIRSRRFSYAAASALMAWWVHAAGFLVAAVEEIVELNGRLWLVYERVMKCLGVKSWRAVAQMNFISNFSISS